MKRIRTFIVSSIIAGFLIVVPLYLALLLLLKAMASLAGLVRPFAALLPDWLPAEDVLALGLGSAAVLPGRRPGPDRGGPPNPGAG